MSSYDSGMTTPLPPNDDIMGKLAELATMSASHEAKLDAASRGG